MAVVSLLRCIKAIKQRQKKVKKTHTQALSNVGLRFLYTVFFVLFIGLLLFPLRSAGAKALRFTKAHKPLYYNRLNP